MSIERFYSSVKSEWGLIGRLSYVTAEALDIGGRQHQRIIANAPRNTAIHGKPLFYADTYLAKDDLTVFEYARHKSHPQFFFEAFSKFYDEIAKDYELAGKQFQLVLNRNGVLTEDSVRFPFDSQSYVKGLKFCRISLPIGDIAIEFSSRICEAGNQLEGIKRKELTKTFSNLGTPFCRHGPLVLSRTAISKSACTSKRVKRKPPITASVHSVSHHPWGGLHGQF
jgi:hypothetical protein